MCEAPAPRAAAQLQGRDTPPDPKARPLQRYSRRGCGNQAGHRRHCCQGRKRGVSCRPRQAAARSAPFRPRGKSRLARIQLAPTPPYAGNQGSAPIGRGGPTTDGAAGSRNWRKRGRLRPFNDLVLPQTGGNQGRGASALLAGRPGPRGARAGRPGIDEADLSENGDKGSALLNGGGA